MFIAEGYCLGFISAVTDAKGAVTRYEYTPTGKVSKATKADGSTEQYQYDKNGNLIKYIDAKGNATTYTYDSMDRLVAVKDALGGVKTIKYTACGQIAEFIDENGNKTKYSYDELDRLVEVTDAKGARTNYAYDAVGNLTAVHQYVGVTKDTVNAMGLSIWQKSAYPTGLTEQVTRYVYDDRGLLVKEINPANKVTVYTYDANGNLVSKVDEEGYTTSFAYDPENNLKKITYHDGKQVEYQYDALNQVIGMKDWLGETTYELDALGRLLKVKDYQNQITEYTWSSTGEKQSIKYPDDSVVSYEYDALGRMTKVTDAQNKVTTYQYDQLGNLTQKLLPNGVKTKYQYDALSRITRLSNYNKMGKLLDDYKYSYDAVGNKNKIERYNYDKGFLGLLGDETEGVTKYNYDQLNQLVEVIKPNKKVEKYFYDTIGNRVRTENWTFGILTDASDYKYDNLNQLKEIKGSAFPAFCHAFPGQSLKMEYDQRGNLIKTTSGNKVIGQYTFDAANRLTEATNAFGVKTNFVYDGDGRRVKMEVIQPKQNIPGFPCIPGFTSGLLSDLLPNCNVNNNGYVTEKDFYNWLCNGKDNKVEYNYALDITEPYENVLLVYGKEIDTQRYTYGLDVISVDTWDKKADVFSWVWGCLKIRCPQKSERSYYLQDELGSPRRLIGETGNTKALYSYDAFGKPIEPLNPFSHIATIDNIYSYTGYQYDLSTGLMYAQARYYMPETGRFISRDPYKGNVVDPQSLNLYVYCKNNPILYFDPSGYDAVLDQYISDNFDGKITVTFIVAQPMPGSRLAIDADFSGDVGHTFIRLDFGDGRVIYKGFYPKNALTPEQIINKENVPGIIRDDSEHGWDVAQVFVIDQKQAEKIEKFINNYEKEYNMVRNNCTTFAVDTLKSAGIKSPTSARIWTLPDGAQKLLVDNLPEEMWFKNIVAWWLLHGLKGYSPADAGEDIRENECAIINTNDTVSPVSTNSGGKKR